MVEGENGLHYGGTGGPTNYFIVCKHGTKKERAQKKETRKKVSSNLKKGYVAISSSKQNTRQFISR